MAGIPRPESNAEGVGEHDETIQEEMVAEERFASDRACEARSQLVSACGSRAGRGESNSVSQLMRVQ